MRMTAPAEQAFMPLTAAHPDAARWLAHSPQGPAPAWVMALRATAAAHFSVTGLPHPGMEAWRYMNLRALSRAAYQYDRPVAQVDLPAPVEGMDGRIVLVNGALRTDLSTVPAGVTFSSLMQAAVRAEVEEEAVNAGDFGDDPFKALNAAHLRDGFVMDVAGDAQARIEVLFYNAGDAAAIYPRVLYRVAQSSAVTVIERHAGQGAYLTAPVTTITLAEKARLRFYRLMEDSSTAHHLSSTTVRQEKDSSFEGFSLASGAHLARESWSALLTGNTTFTSISGVYMLKHNQNHDFTVSVTHCEPDGKSEQFFKGVADDEARAVFQGAIHVSRGAQKTNGSQSHHALLLSPRAEARFKPGLDIRADDVKCSHGATLGQIDPVALFYLRSRGIPEAEARALLIESFLSGAAARITDAGAAALVQGRIADWLMQRGAA